MLLVTVTVGEIVYSRRQHASVTDAVAVLLYFFADGVQVGLGGPYVGPCQIIRR